MFDWRLTAIMLRHILTAVGHPAAFNVVGTGLDRDSLTDPVTRASGAAVRVCATSRQRSEMAQRA
jgi:hypothetical protein